jgi:hypothetical protein
MTLEQAKQVSDILKKINQYEESIHSLTYSETHNIIFGKLHKINSYIIIDKEVVDEIVNHSIFILKEKIITLTKQLENL